MAHSDRTSGQISDAHDGWWRDAQWFRSGSIEVHATGLRYLRVPTSDELSCCYFQRVTDNTAAAIIEHIQRRPTAQLVSGHCSDKRMD